MATAACSDVHVRKMIVTPAMAKQWLGLNTRNRPVQKNRVQLLKEQIENGSFVLTHQGIAFYGDFEELADGQHRLAAIADGDTSVEMFVTVGLSRDTVHGIDRGRPRSIANVLHFLGMPVGSKQVAVCRALWQDYHAARTESCWDGRTMATSDFAAFCDHVLQAVTFSMPTRICRGLSHASVTAAIAAAWFSQNHDELARFKDLLHNGSGAASHEAAAIRLREYLLTTTLGTGGSEARQELYFRASTALRAFLERRPLAKLYCRPDARFPIPDCPEIA